jgi:type I restriction enzyme S subunit
MKSYRLRELLSIKNGRDHKELADGLIPIYGSGGIMRYGNKAIFYQESILLPRKGTLSNIQYVKEPFWTVDTIYYTVVNRDLANPFFLYNYLKSLDLSKLNTGTGVPSMTFDSYYNLEINLPSLDTQDKIAHLLDVINCKIELNNKINAELESMAKIIYDYWFVQFDFPDKNGKPYKSFGGKMVWNEELKREIPEGWEVKELGQILRTELGGTPSTKEREFWDGDFPWLNSGEIANFPIIDSELKITEAGIKSSATTLMPKGTCVLSITRHLRPSILGVDSCANQSVVGVFESEKIKNSFIYPYLVNDIPRLMTLRSGAQQPHINKGTVDVSKMIIPIDQVLNQYYKVVDAFYNKILNNAFQIQHLTELRDWLLPMLMNGQVS